MSWFRTVGKHEACQVWYITANKNKKHAMAFYKTSGKHETCQAWSKV